MCPRSGTSSPRDARSEAIKILSLPAVNAAKVLLLDLVAAAFVSVPSRFWSGGWSVASRCDSRAAFSLLFVKTSTREEMSAGFARPVVADCGCAEETCREGISPTSESVDSSSEEDSALSESEDDEDDESEE